MTITCIPLGFRFHPTDVELIKFYLKRKVVGKRFRYEVIVEIDIYKYYPWDLPDKSCLRSKDLQWYFFCPRERKYSNGARMNRATEYGYWKTTGKDRSVIYKERIVGLIKTLIFHTGRAPNGVRTDWVMHEYRLEDKDLADAGVVQDAYVLCKIFQKSGSGPRNGAQYGAPFNEEEWSDDEDVAGVESFPLAGLPALAPVLQNNQDSSAVTSTLIPGSICIGSSSKPVQSPDNMIRPVQDEDVLMREVPLIPDDGNDICSMLDDIILVPNENHENENMDYSNGDGIIQTASLDVNYIYNDFAWPETLPELNEDELFSYGSKTDFASNQLPACEDGLYLELNDLQVLLGGPSDTYGSQGTPLNPVPSHYNFCTSSEQPRYPLNYYDDAVQDGSGISQSSVLPAGSYGFESHLVVNQEDNGVKEDANQGYREYEATLKNAEVTVWNQPELEIRYVSQGQTRGLRMNDLTTTTPMTVNGLGAFDLTPKCGMEFDSEEDAYNFYTAYGGKLGFGIRRDTYNKNRRTGEMTSRIFVCNKEGVRGKDKRDHLTKKPRQEIRAGCEARMSIKLNRHNGKYAINDIKEEHNHDLVIPECIHKLPSERKMSALQATKVELVEESRVPLRSAYELMGRQAGGRDSLGYTKQDQKNCLRTKRQNKLAYGEAGSILKYFQTQTLDNPSFFHAVQLDNEEQITNIFWADARMIIDFGLFGDVVSFDTTYKINKENRPFAVFVGFNHHRETVVFGAALMYDETADSFKWLFESFLEAMCYKAPKTIFTFQDAAMANAISCVLPNTYHRFCRWHMNQNAINHVNADVRSDLSIFWDYVENEEGIQLSENFNESLKLYLKSNHDVVQFFVHFERLLEEKRYKELIAEYSLAQKFADVKVPVTMLIEARKTYTNVIFEDFQKEYVKSLEACIKTCVEDGETSVYTITRHGHSYERQVTKGRENILSCSCTLFERRGFLCSHAIKVLRDVMNIMELPSHYILKRWTRKARAECVQDMHGGVIQADASLQRTTRYRSLCSIFTRVLSRASESEETYNIALSKANKLLKLTEDMLGLQLDGLVQDNENPTPPSITCEGDIQAHGLGKAHVIQAKGLKKRAPSTHRGKRRIKSPLQIASGRIQKPSSSHSFQGSSVPEYNTITNEDGPHPPPHLQPSQTYLGLNVPKKITTTNEDSPHLPQHSQPSQISLPVNHMASSNLCSSMMYQTYPGPSVPNSEPWPTYTEPQHTPGYAFSFQDSQTSNHTAGRECVLGGLDEFDINSSIPFHRQPCFLQTAVPPSP